MKTEIIEDGITMTLQTCPECNGFGNTFSNTLKGKECLCNGFSEVFYDNISGFGMTINNFSFRY
jgi:hypothetical protein